MPSQGCWQRGQARHLPPWILGKNIKVEKTEKNERNIPSSNTKNYNYFLNLFFYPKYKSINNLWLKRKFVRKFSCCPPLEKNPGETHSLVPMVHLLLPSYIFCTATTLFYILH
jgi:hypothetical protein